jgi:hypothetical protein
MRWIGGQFTPADSFTCRVLAMESSGEMLATPNHSSVLSPAWPKMYKFYIWFLDARTYLGMMIKNTLPVATPQPTTTTHMTTLVPSMARKGKAVSVVI